MALCSRSGDSGVTTSDPGNGMEPQYSTSLTIPLSWAGALPGMNITKITNIKTTPIQPSHPPLVSLVILDVNKNDKCLMLVSPQSEAVY